MINLSTPSEELWNTLDVEYNKAKYWMIKHFGGEASYEKMRDDLLRRSTYGERAMASEVVDYTSKDGNRWICFEYSRYYPESHGSHCMPLLFCYYETASSIGVFMMGFKSTPSGDYMNSVVIYTPHFFQRFCERMKFEGTPREQLMKFVELSPSFMVTEMPDDGSGMDRIVVRIGGFTGYGIKRSGNRRVYEVRTLLNDGQLSHKQSRDTEKIREIGDAMVFEPKDMYAQRLKNSGDPYLILNEELEHLEKMGIDTTNRKSALNVSLMMSQILVKLGLADSMDYAYWNTFNEKSAPLIIDFVNRMNEESDKFQFFDEYLKLVKLVAPRIGIRKFNWRKFAEVTLIDIYHFTPDAAEQTINKFYPKNK